MDGAREYSNLNIEGQHGRLFISMSKHARGHTMSIQVLPDGEKAELNCNLLTHQCLNKDAVEVYEAVSGNRGWTEVYGWLHKGPWVSEFEEIVKKARHEKASLKKKNEDLKLNQEQKAESRVQSLLENY